ncbi:hypothetical protein P7F88_08245 [Vibrio hannami]|uniref:hypothetical protein n=1 Tax=Vibrio hannami TaxID=2717094 RepID=UPI00240F5495|nr:hypothetical protein [Vibrio hannami]MDG3086088.1 hypothetical protein [Vibrio hannami]
MIENKGIVIDCSALNQQVHLFITSENSQGMLKIMTDSGGRLSSTVTLGSSISYSINKTECPLTIVYDAQNGHMEYTVGSDGVLN